MRHLNYNHLLYFWTVVREGGVSAAAERLFLTPQTISGQLRVLEGQVGGRLFSRAGRRLVLTELGRVVYRYADEMFPLGVELMDVLKGRAPGGPVLFTVGIADVVPKLVAYRLLTPALKLDPPVRFVCHEGRIDDLLADLAVHKLDLVLADCPVHPSFNIRAYSHLLGESTVSLFATRAAAPRYRADFPASLAGAPMLLPTPNTSLRRSLEQWLDQHALNPVIAGEFADSALLKAFGQAGAGVFPAPTAIAEEVREQYGVECIGQADGIRERFYAISAERRLKHPAVLAVRDAARDTLGDVREEA